MKSLENQGSFICHLKEYYMITLTGLNSNPPLWLLGSKSIETTSDQQLSDCLLNH